MSSDPRLPRSAFRAVVIGASAGGFEAMSNIFANIPSDFPWPILIVQHLHPTDEGRFCEHLSTAAPVPVIEPCDKEKIEPGKSYMAPANYHMIVESDETIALTVDEKCNYSRPSINVLFESAARVWKESLIGIILSGANFDGTEGIREIHVFGGLTIAQDPKTATHPVMPKAAIESGKIDKVFSPRQIGEFLTASCKSAAGTSGTRS